MTSTNPVILIILGFLPSLIWLAFYLKKDLHPEPKYLISKTFLAGIMLAPLAVGMQWIFREIIINFKPAYHIQSSVWFFLWAAAIEEIVKFLVVMFVVMRNPEFDEPTDAMIYMISAGLGFAAIENILVLFQVSSSGISAAIQIWLLRFAGATLLHAVASAIIGYFLALSWFYRRHSPKLILLGITTATVVHLIFNMILISFGGKTNSESFIYSTLFLIFIAGLISVLFSKLKKGSVDNMYLPKVS